MRRKWLPTPVVFYPETYDAISTRRLENPLVFRIQKREGGFFCLTGAYDLLPTQWHMWHVSPTLKSAKAWVRRNFGWWIE